MRILVTGATGFIGRHVVNYLLQLGHSIIAVARNAEKAKVMPWINQVTFIECDLHKDFSTIITPQLKVDMIVHLAWPGLPNYKDYFHVEINLTADIKFLTAAVLSGVPRLIVTGTCLEYGMQYGPLSEDMKTLPTTPYGFAKDALRKSLQFLQHQHSFILQWVRLFYMFGEGQRADSILSQLEYAIKERKENFNMSEGNQLRDYLPVDEVATFFGQLVAHPECNGVINCCSGKPVSVRQLVEKYCKTHNSDIKLNLGFYPYPDYEPIAFWGVPAKLSKLCFEILL